MLLCTDGVIEARDRDGTFYPFAERTDQWTDNRLRCADAEGSLVAY
ncbi:hypothetical protein [Streptomyces sp. NPDC056190]